jgi:carbamoyltransferase
MGVLGINAYAHNAAAVVYDREGTVGAEQERFDHKRRSGAFPIDVLRDVILPITDRNAIKAVAFPWKPLRFLRTYLRLCCNDLPRSLSLIHPRACPHLNVASGVRFLRLRSELARALGVFRAPVRFVEHHLAHASNAFFSSDFDRALVLVADGFGDTCSLSLYLGEKDGLSLIARNSLLDSLGILYACVTQHLGFRTLHDEGKVMALSAYGDDSLEREFARIVQCLPGGRYRFDVSYLNYNSSGERRPFSEKFERAFGPARAPGEPLGARHYNLAKALQRTVERVIVHVVRYAAGAHRVDRLCFSGGVALNCVLNGRLVSDTGLRSIFVPPAPDDSGAALGAAQAVAHLELGWPRYTLDSAALGPEYTVGRIGAALRGEQCEISEPPDAAEKVAELLAKGCVVGWFQGRMEYGPRALGQRSILADPRRRDIQQVLNGMKRREAFRPFALAILSEHVHEVVRPALPSPYMGFAGVVRREMRASIPGAVHVDGSVRFQTVEPAAGSLRLRAVVEAFYRRTGIPCVVNTSLNCQMPIAATPEDALACFHAAGLDAICLGPYLVQRGPERPRHDESSALAATARAVPR